MPKPKRPSDHMDEHPQNAWGAISYDAKFDEYWIPSGDARQCLFFCPFCGERLPESKRGRWFEELGALGIADPWHDEIPVEYQSDAWRKR